MKEIILPSLLATLIPLQVMLPFTLALTLVFFKKAKSSIRLTQIYLFISFLASLALTVAVYIDSAQYITYLFGNFEPIAGIQYKVNIIICFVLLLTAFVANIGYYWGKKLLSIEIGLNKIYLFNILYLTFYTGLLGVILTQDLFNIFIFTEIASLASYALIGMNRSSRSSPVTAFNYLIIGSIAISLYVLGVGIIYLTTGSLNIPIVSQKLPLVSNASVTLAVLLIIIFTMMKIGIFPFSAIIPKVYCDTPFIVNPLMSGMAGKIIIYAYIKIAFIFLNSIASDKTQIFIAIFNTLTIVTILMAGIIAIMQKNLKSLLSWSSLSYVGYIFLIIFEDNKSIINAILLLIIWHSITKCGLFMVAGNIKYLFNTTNLNQMGGFYKKSLFNFIAFIILALSLIGVPGTFGFIVKWYLVGVLLQSNLTLFVIIVLISSGISILYVWKVIEQIIFSESENMNIFNNTKTIPFRMNVMLMLLIGITLGCGIFGNYLITFLYNIVNGALQH